MTAPAPLSPARATLLVRNVARAIALAWRLDRVMVGSYVAAQLGDALLPVAIAYVGKRIVDAVVTAAASHGTDRAATHAALVQVSIELTLFVARHAIGQWSGYLATVMRTRLGPHVAELIFEKTLSLSLKHFEDPEFIDAMERARKESDWRPVEILTSGFSLVRSVVTLAGFAVLLSRFSGWAVAALLLASLPFFAEMHYAADFHALHLRRTADERQAGYLQSLLCSDSHAKEVKLFGLGRMLVGRYRALNERFYREDRSFARRRGLAVTLLGGLSAVAFYAVYAFVVVRAASGAITLGAMTLYLTVFRQGQQAFQNAMSALSRTYEDNLYVGNLFSFLAIEPDDTTTDTFVDPGARGTSPPEIRFEHVSFGYPGDRGAALSDVDVVIRAGETVALVGPNGAGKTTLVKLLTGLHTPSSGRIVLGGEDVATMDRSALRSRIGVVFQDFVHYHFTAGDNVGMGWLPALHDRDAIAAASRVAGASDVLESLPQGYDTTLGRWFGGSELSIGQWQRIALARAFMRHSDVLVLDEPTAALDAEGEHEVFERFRALKANRTAVLITHRFSTVRMADRIIVLEAGRVVEVGTHAELLARGGLYARMFRRQAAGYVDAASA